MKEREKEKEKERKTVPLTDAELMYHVCTHVNCECNACRIDQTVWTDITETCQEINATFESGRSISTEIKEISSFRKKVRVNGNSKIKKNQ